MILDTLKPATLGLAILLGIFVKCSVDAPRVAQLIDTPGCGQSQLIPCLSQQIHHL